MYSRYVRDKPELIVMQTENNIKIISPFCKITRNCYLIYSSANKFSICKPHISFFVIQSYNLCLFINIRSVVINTGLEIR